MSFMTLRVSGYQAWALFDDSDGSEPAVVPITDLTYPNAARFERLEGFGCQYSASGYMDQTDWCIAPSAIGAVRECARLYGGDFIKGEDDDDRNDLAWAYRYARSLDRAARKAPKGMGRGMKRARLRTPRDLANLRMLFEISQFLAYAALAAETE